MRLSPVLSLLALCLPAAEAQDGQPGALSHPVERQVTAAAAAPLQVVQPVSLNGRVTAVAVSQGSLRVVLQGGETVTLRRWTGPAPLAWVGGDLQLTVADAPEQRPTSLAVRKNGALHTWIGWNVRGGQVLAAELPWTLSSIGPGRAVLKSASGDQQPLRSGQTALLTNGGAHRWSVQLLGTSARRPDAAARPAEMQARFYTATVMVSLLEAE